MKQGSVDTDRLMPEGRNSFYRRKMSKNSPVLNGDAETMDRTLARGLNLFVTFQDHLTSTKSASEFRTIDTLPREVRVNNNLACETDHIYANCSDTKNKSIITSSTSSPKELTSIEVSEIIYHSDVIGHLRKQLALKNQVIKPLQTHLDCNHRERKICLSRKRYSRQSIGSVSGRTDNLTAAITPTGAPFKNPSNLATRYFGRKSKTVPLRALKRRYIVPSMTRPKKRLINVSSKEPLDVNVLEKPKSLTIKQEIVDTCEVNETIPTPPKVCKKRGRKPKKVLIKRGHLTTDSAYFLPDNQTLLHSYSPPQIDVPLWKIKPVSSFYQMEGTENINDIVFQRRHIKCELDERRRKRWDMQRLREQKAIQKLKLKYNRAFGKEGESYRKSFYPDPRYIECIEVADVLPVMAFGHIIPFFQPCEFSLPWTCNQKQNYPDIRKGRSSQTSKVT